MLDGYIYALGGGPVSGGYIGQIRVLAEAWADRPEVGNGIQKVLVLLGGQRVQWERLVRAQGF